jgi:hypothetical protein
MKRSDSAAILASLDTTRVSGENCFILSVVIDVYGVKSTGQFVNTLLEVIHCRGAMDKLITDGAAAEISKRVIDVLRNLIINSWHSEAHFQHQNFAERRWQDLKGLTTSLHG